MNSDKAVLNRNYEYRNVFRLGKSQVSPIVITYVRKKKKGKLFTGVSASKKIGGAVVRNRARRVVKAAARDVLKEVSEPCDIVFVCRSATARAKSQDVAAVMRSQLKTLGVIPK